MEPNDTEEGQDYALAIEEPKDSNFREMEKERQEQEKILQRERNSKIHFLQVHCVDCSRSMRKSLTFMGTPKIKQVKKLVEQNLNTTPNLQKSKEDSSSSSSSPSSPPLPVKHFSCLLKFSASPTLLVDVNENHESQKALIMRSTTSLWSKEAPLSLPWNL
eukprot:TRINITY_DN5783_c0_g2_i1.p1 TRINITY_DN5783_c0_g2~~TRINITY_DN5783_c0_g2_i1.p1  ORF type:complete len:169 (-),score=60.13 TRINITY_DN5783_c0_g2_i1:51-533(-)